MDESLKQKWQELYDLLLLKTLDIEQILYFIKTVMGKKKLKCC